MVVISETVKITKVTCETEVINKVTNIDCSENPSEAGTKMVEERKQDSDCNQVCFRHTPSQMQNVSHYIFRKLHNE